MKAVGYIKSLPINDPESLTDIELDQPGYGWRHRLRHRDRYLEVLRHHRHGGRGPAAGSAGGDRRGGVEIAPAWKSRCWALKSIEICRI